MYVRTKERLLTTILSRRYEGIGLKMMILIWWEWQVRLGANVSHESYGFISGTRTCRVKFEEVGKLVRIVKRSMTNIVSCLVNNGERVTGLSMQPKL